MGQAKGTRASGIVTISPGMFDDARDDTNSGFPKHPEGVNSGKTDILAGTPAAMSSVADTDPDMHTGG